MLNNSGAEKSPKKVLIGGIQKFSIEDGPGIRTTTFLKGCPLTCKWCHNPELIDFDQHVIIMPNNCIGCGYCVDICPQHAISPDPDNRGKIRIDRTLCDNCMECTEICYAKALQPVAQEMSVAEILEEVEQDIDFYRHTEGGLTISGGEMLSHADFSQDLITGCKEKNIGVCIDTSGYGDEERLEALALNENVTNVLYDMKSVDNDIHKEYTGCDNGLILENLSKIAKNPKILPKIIMRMPLVKDINDTKNIINETAGLYKELGIQRVTLLPYHNLGISKERNIGGRQTEFRPPGDERMKTIKNIFENTEGVDVEVLGGV
jgi:pyruvate formate lyase activating enzyme